MVPSEASDAASRSSSGMIAWWSDRTIFSYGFRPFFLAAGVYAILAMVVWLAVFQGVIGWAGPWPAVLWHAHELLYGFAVAGSAGFLLTAVPNWTSSQAPRGQVLVWLTLLWIAGRVAMAMQSILPAFVVAAIDLAFLPALAIPVAGLLLGWLKKAQNTRNLFFLALLTILWVGNLLSHLFVAADLSIGAKGLVLGRDTLLLMVTIVGGRIVPSFTQNALRAAGRARSIRKYPLIESLAIGSVVAMLIGDFLFDNGQLTGVIALIAAAANAIRLSSWHSLSTWRWPILAVLHLGYGWLVVGLGIKAMADLAGWVPQVTVMHIFTAGTIATALLAVMSRAALGHTGRPLVASWPTAVAYVLLTLAVVLRAIAPLTEGAYIILINTSGACWVLAFSFFTAVYAPILLRPRIDGKPD